MTPFNRRLVVIAMAVSLLAVAIAIAVQNWLLAGLGWNAFHQSMLTAALA